VITIDDNICGPLVAIKFSLWPSASSVLCSFVFTICFVVILLAYNEEYHLLNFEKSDVNDDVIVTS